MRNFFFILMFCGASQICDAKAFPRPSFIFDLTDILINQTHSYVLSGEKKLVKPKTKVVMKGRIVPPVKVPNLVPMLKMEESAKCMPEIKREGIWIISDPIK